MSESSCDVCSGSRLNEQSRNVYINNTQIHTITGMRINDSLNFIKNMKLEGSKQKIAEKISKGIADFSPTLKKHFTSSHLKIFIS